MTTAGIVFVATVVAAMSVFAAFLVWASHQHRS